jgi:hypothetical protein
VRWAQQNNKLETKVADVSIRKTHGIIQMNTSTDTGIDSLEVAEQVEEYRQFWKPQKTNVVLLAESHVYTDQQDFTMKCEESILHKIIPDYPLRFVRFVYCLAYGENGLLKTVRTDRKNTGTPQYWKIFSSCVAENERNLGFSNVLKTGTPFLLSRLQNKVDVLRKMKTQGIWLLDASIVGLYGSGKKNPAMAERTIEICWRNYIANIIVESNPRHVIVIGKGVGRILGPWLQRVDVLFTVIPQPQARGTSRWQLENYRQYYRVCAKYS